MKLFLLKILYQASMLMVVVHLRSSRSMPATSLYLSDDSLMVLDSSNFSQTLRFKSNAFLIQFYNSWCGHCISFVPTFRRFARNVSQWKPVVQVGVVNCADTRNTKLCSDNMINMYPSLKLYWINANIDADPLRAGRVFEGDARTVESIRHGLIDFLVTSWSTGAPREWPDLMAISALNKDQFMRMIPLKPMKPVLLIVENEHSYVGREVIMDLANYQNEVTVLRMLDSSRLLLDQLLPKKLESYALPILLLIKKSDYSIEVLETAANYNVRETFVSTVKQKFILKPMQMSTLATRVDAKKGRQHALDGVYMSDLVSALRYSIYQEIPLKSRLNSTQLTVFKRFLSIIMDHFPFENEDESTFNFIKQLSQWTSSHVHYVNMYDMVNAMNQIEMNSKLPDIQEWKGCAGSSSQFRGYPCALWTLFHVLTVSELTKAESQSKWSNLHEVLYTIRDYVGHFFTCSICAKHFSGVSSKLESQLIYPNSSVLWLWSTHNQVNDRLSGDESEDQNHPKIQFPSRFMCPSCYNKDSSWNEKNILHFIKKFYGREQIIKNVHISNAKPILTNSVSYNSSPSSANRNWKYSFINGIDISLCLILYVFITCLLISLYLIIKLKKRKKSNRTAANVTKNYYHMP